MDDKLIVLLYTGGSIATLYLTIKLIEAITSLVKKYNGKKDDKADYVYIHENSAVFEMLRKLTEVMQDMSGSMIMNVENTARGVKVGEDTVKILNELKTEAAVMSNKLDNLKKT